MVRGHRKTLGSGILGFGNQCSGGNRKKWEAAGSSARRILQSFRHESMASTVWSHARKIQVGREDIHMPGAKRPLNRFHQGRPRQLRESPQG